MFTVGTLHKDHVFRGRHNLDKLVEQLLEHLAEAGWTADAWAIFSNHYHLIVSVPPDSKSVSAFFRDFHSASADAINKRDSASGRQVWHQYWDKELTYERSILARTAYVWHNPVHHGVVRSPEQYRWCGAGWRAATRGRYTESTLRSFDPSRLKIDDDFEVVLDA